MGILTMGRKRTADSRKEKIQKSRNLTNQKGEREQNQIQKSRNLTNQKGEREQKILGIGDFERQNYEAHFELQRKLDEIWDLRAQKR
jgi:hypothetical protein